MKIKLLLEFSSPHNQMLCLVFRNKSCFGGYHRSSLVLILCLELRVKRTGLVIFSVSKCTQVPSLSHSFYSQSVTWAVVTWAPETGASVGPASWSPMVIAGIIAMPLQVMGH